MKKLLRIALPITLAVSAFGVGAQTIETDYPQVRGNVGIAVPAPVTQFAAQGVASHGEPLLVQSNFEGPKANPAVVAPSTLSRAEVRASATISKPRGPGHNA